MKTALRHLFLLSFVLALAACGNKGPLVMPPSPVPDEQPRQIDEPVDEDEAIDGGDGNGPARGL